MATLEGGRGAPGFAAGLAANVAVLDLLRAADRLVAPVEGYYRSLKQFTEHTVRCGATIEFADFRDPAAVEAAVDSRTRPLWIESPANPLLSISDLKVITAIGHEAGALVICDNTFATPICQRPFDFGADGCDSQRDQVVRSIRAHTHCVSIMRVYWV